MAVAAGVGLISTVSVRAGETSTTAISAAEFRRLLQQAAPGSTIDLGSRRVAFKRFRFQPAGPITIRGGVFNAIILDGWRNVTFDGSRFRPGPADGTKAILLNAYAPQSLRLRNVTFTGGRIAGVLAFSSLRVTDGSDISVTNSTFRDIANFIDFVRTSNIDFSDNDLSNIREGVHLISVSNATVARNRIGTFDNKAADHPDGIQMFTIGLTRPTDHGSRDVVIEDNLIISGPKKPTQGVWIKDDAGFFAQGRGFERITIRRNTFVGTGWHGIGVPFPVKNLVIEDNRLILRPKFDNWIMATGPRIVVRGNEAGSYHLPTDAITSNNKLVSRRPDLAELRTIQTSWDARYRPGKVYPFSTM